MSFTPGNQKRKIKKKDIKSKVISAISAWVVSHVAVTVGIVVVMFLFLLMGAAIIFDWVLPNDDVCTCELYIAERHDGVDQTVQGGSTGSLDGSTGAEIGADGLWAGGTDYYGYKFPKYNLSDDEIRKIAAIVTRENSASEEAMRAEASQMANRYEMFPAYKKYSSITEMITQDPWYAGNKDPLPPSDKCLEVVKDALNNGNRYFPPYIVEHVTGSGGKYSTEWMSLLTLDGKQLDAGKLENYKANETKIQDKTSSNYYWYFYKIPGNTFATDPFGYNDEGWNLYKKWCEANGVTPVKDGVDNPKPSTNTTTASDATSLGEDVKYDVTSLPNVTNFHMKETSASNQVLNSKIAWAFMILDMGLTEEQAAGLWGNLCHESGGFDSANGKGGSHIGLVQWGDGRKTNLLNYAKQQGTDWTDCLTQLRFMKQELETSYPKVYAQLKSSTSVADAAKLIMDKYEIPGDNSLQKRIDSGQSAYNAWKGLKVSKVANNTTTSTNSNTSTSSTSSSSSSTQSSASSSTQSGSTSSSTSSTTSTSTDSASVPSSYTISQINKVKVVNQYNLGLHSGCESCATTAAFEALGIDISVSEFVSNYLDKGAKGSTTPYEKFVGDPYSAQDSFGCFPPVIVKAINKGLQAKSLSDKFDVKDITGTDVEALFNYIRADVPVIIWGTLKNGDPMTSSFTYKNPSGVTEKWPRPEHCMLLVGYSEGKVKVVDSDVGSIVDYPISSFKTHASYVNAGNAGCRAVAIIPKGTTISNAGVSGGAKSVQYSEHKGQYSGLWPDLHGDFEKADAGIIKDWRQLEPFVGFGMLKGVNWENNNWKDVNGVGPISYNMAELTGYGHLQQSKYHRESPFSGGSCSLCSLAQAMSTMTGLCVNPAEVSIAANTYDVRHPGKKLFCNGFSNVLSTADMVALLEETGFKAERRSGNIQMAENKEAAAKCLEEGGYVIAAQYQHFITFYNYDRATDKFYLNDCGARAKCGKGYSISSFTKDPRNNGIVLIYSGPDGITSNGVGVDGASGTGTSTGTDEGYIVYKCANCCCYAKGEKNCNCHEGLSIPKDGLKIYTGKNGVVTIEGGQVSLDSSSTVANNDSAGAVITVGSYTTQAGVAQGDYGGKTLEQICQENGTMNLYNRAKKYFGQAALLNGGTKNPNGSIYYSQAGGVESWAGDLPLGNSGSDGGLASSGCYFYMSAHILTTVTGKVINPAEVWVLYHTYGCVTSSGGSYNGTNLNKIYNPLGYKVTSCQLSDLKNNPALKKRFDDALRAGIPQGFRTTYGADYATTQKQNNSHYLCVDKVSDDGTQYMVAQSARTSNGAQNRWYTLDYLIKYGYNKNPNCWIVERQ